MNPVFEKIEKDIKGNDIVLYMKGTKDMPMCGFSAFVATILDRMGLSDRTKDVNVLEDDTIRQGIKDYTQWPTIPQLYIKGEFVGGADIIREMFQTGELQQLLKDRGIPFREEDAA